MIPLTTTIVNIINIINLTVDYNLINIITRKNNQITIKRKNTIKTKIILVHVINIDKRLTILITNNSIREWCIMINSNNNISNLIISNRRAWCSC